jgi:phospholipase C
LINRADIKSAGGVAPRVRTQGLSTGHILVIYLENRSFDNLFGEFPGVDGIVIRATARRG